MRVVIGAGLLCLAAPASAQTAPAVVEAQPAQQPSITSSGRPSGAA